STAMGYTSQGAYVSGGCGLSGLCPTAPAATPPDQRPLGDGPMPYKYRKSDNGANWTLNDVDTPLYRYAEAILMYAEAQNELGSQAVAVQYLNLIRARARKGTGAESRTEPHDYGAAGEAMTQTAIRDAIFQERDWELAHEGKRWFDLLELDALEPGYWAMALQQRDSILATAPLQRD